MWWGDSLHEEITATSQVVSRCPGRALMNVKGCQYGVQKCKSRASLELRTFRGLTHLLCGVLAIRNDQPKRKQPIRERRAKVEGGAQ